MAEGERKILTPGEVARLGEQGPEIHVMVPPQMLLDIVMKSMQMSGLAGFVVTADARLTRIEEALNLPPWADVVKKLREEREAESDVNSSETPAGGVPIDSGDDRGVGSGADS